MASLKGKWALVLGASSGHGAATALELARHGMNVFGVHLDTRATLPNAQRVQAQIHDLGCEAVFFNTNAADDQKRRQVLEAVRQRLPEGEHVRVLMHSLAFGTLRPYVPPDRADAVTRNQMEMTLDVMAHSLVYWVQDMYYLGLLGPGSKVFAMTSAGSHRVFPNYGPVGAAKAALEYHVKHLAVELSRRGIAVNAIQAGVTDTPALRKIPGHERMLEYASQYNPGGRITTPQDVARAIVALSQDESPWLTGNVICVDGGEDLVLI
ncbi:Enoyl-[acyl-carrier-protein] reductase [NADPH] FabL [bacterium HR24]|jgi:NAD(P)-dependent dehydrogenase (short-subunit alcohol dehydrogenase family)|nr:Enoyl-[acyl-carrier-protein] reductase [NADPH] FabL [bacterium HR24]